MIASEQCSVIGDVPDAPVVVHDVVEPSLLGCFWRDRKSSRASSALRSAGHSFGLLFCISLLAGCTTTATRQAAPAASVEVLDNQRGQVVEWTLAGRIAVSNGRDGGSGRIDWQQD